MTKPSLLVIGHTYTISVNRRKLWALANYFQVTCATSALLGQQVFGRPIEDFEETGIQEPIDVFRFTELPPNKEPTKFLYRRLGKLFRRRHFDFILVESEPWGAVKWQSWFLTRRFQPRSLFGEFSWENLERGGLKGFLLAMVYRASALTDDFSVSGNQACRDLFLKHGADPKKNLLAAQLGVDTILFRPVSIEEKNSIRGRLGLESDSFLVGYCGRLVPEKGLLELREAVRQVRNTNPRVQLAILGDGILRAELRRGGESWIHLLESRPHFEIPPFLQSLDLFVLASKPVRESNRVWEEQFGHVLIEAMACGVPTLGSDSGAILEVLNSPEAIFHHSDVSSLAEKLRQNIASPERRRRLAGRQFERVTKFYSHEAVAAIYASFLESVRAL